MAFIVDIRRQNLLHHLLYKALIELSPTRADFLSRLFGRAKPQGLRVERARRSAAHRVHRRAAGRRADRTRTASARFSIISSRKHSFTLDEDDTRVIEYIYQHVLPIRARASRYAPVAAVVSAAATSARHLDAVSGVRRSQMQTRRRGPNRGYLANEAQLRHRCATCSCKNLIVPIVGDFAGPKALRAVGSFVRERAGR